MAWMMIGNDLANMTHHLGSQSQTQIMISLIAFMHRSFRMQQEQLGIYSSPALLEVAWSVGEENVTTHLAAILQELSGKERLTLLAGLQAKDRKNYGELKKYLTFEKWDSYPKAVLRTTISWGRDVSQERKSSVGSLWSSCSIGHWRSLWSRYKFSCFCCLRLVP